jgi:hypothetical protein
VHVERLENKDPRENKVQQGKLERLESRDQQENRGQRENRVQLERWGQQVSKGPLEPKVLWGPPVLLGKQGTNSSQVDPQI